MSEFKDQMGRTITLEKTPGRIISTVPSQTEVLADLGLNDEVVGITKFCVHPEKWKDQKTIIGGTKNIDVGKVQELEPDLVIANKEENIEEKIDQISEFCPVWVSDVKDHDTAIAMIMSIARMTDKEEVGQNWVDRINDARAAIRPPSERSAAYMIWKNPWMTVGGDTFIHQMMATAGMVNVFKNKKRYPLTSLEELRSLAPDLILLSSEPFPFSTEHIKEVSEACPRSEVMIVDGEMFSWYGTRMKKGYEYLKGLASDDNQVFGEVD